MRLAFVVDPLDRLKAYKDSSVAMMREAARRGHAISAFEARSMYVRGDSVRCGAQPLAIHDDDENWYSPAGEAADVRVADFDRVFMRKDPPFDQEYYYATLLLERAAAEGTTVLNDPRALRDWNEKLAILRFPRFTPPMLVASEMARIRAGPQAVGTVRCIDARAPNSPNQPARRGCFARQFNSANRKSR